MVPWNSLAKSLGLEDSRVLYVKVAQCSAGPKESPRPQIDQNEGEKVGSLRIQDGIESPYSVASVSNYVNIQLLNHFLCNLVFGFDKPAIYRLID